MHFGLHVHGMMNTAAPPEANFEKLQEYATVASESQFDLLWVGHHFLLEDRQKFQPVPTLARLAAAAPELHVGANIVLPLHHPVVIAEQFATIDALSGGKAVLSPIQGYRREEFENIGIPRAERATRLDEGVQLIEKLWTEDGVEFRGEHFSVSDATITPKPVQRPRPPIWIGANTDRAVQRAADLGDAWLINPHETEETIARQLDLIDAPEGEGYHGMQPILRNVFVAETDRQAVEIFGPAVQDHFDWYQGEGQDEATENPEEFALQFSELREKRFLIGSPETVADDITRLHDELGIDCLLSSIHRPGIAHEHVREAIRLMGEAVIPEVRARTGA